MMEVYLSCCVMKTNDNPLEANYVIAFGLAVNDDLNVVCSLHGAVVFISFISLLFPPSQFVLNALC